MPRKVNKKSSNKKSLRRDGRDIVERMEASRRRLQDIEIERVLYMRPYSDQELSLEKAVQVLGSFHLMRPQDEVERMIIVQMIGCHEASVECFERASAPGQCPEAVDLYLRNAARLCNTFVNLMRSLDKHRGKGHQKVTVEHVHVEPGGQAIVGNVERG